MSSTIPETIMRTEDLPPFLKGVKITGTVAQRKLTFRRRLMEDGSNNTPIKCQLDVASSPSMFMPQNVKSIYQQNNFAKMLELEKTSQKDVDVLHKNISTFGENAWCRAETEVDGKKVEFYLTASQNACMWVFPKKSGTIRQDGDQKYFVDVQVGTYSNSTGIMGVCTYNLTTTTLIVEAAVSLIITIALSSVIKDGIAFAVAYFAPYIIQAAASLGFQSFSCTILATALTGVAVTLVFVVVFIGLICLWNWINRKYTIRLQIFNWDRNNNWHVEKGCTDNAKIAGGGKLEHVVIQKLDDPKFPPFIKPVKPLDSVCHYAVIVWENDNTYFEGCSMALQMKKENANEGFMWAFSCPRFADNKNKGQNGLMEPEKYLKSGNWNMSPQKFSFSSAGENVPVTVALDALSGAKDNLYNVVIHINH